jgi:hypothetical protein
MKHTLDSALPEQCCKKLRLTCYSGIGLMVVGLAAWMLFTPEPAYHGKPLSHWVRLQNEGTPSERNEATTALRHMGETAVPRLVDRLNRQDSRLGRIIDAFASRFGIQRLADSHQAGADLRRHAANALGEIGPAARVAIPALEAASHRANSGCAASATAALIKIRGEQTNSLSLALLANGNLTNWLRTLEVLICLGSNAQAETQVMLGTIATNSVASRMKLVEELGGNYCEPAASVLILAGLLQDPNWGIRANALNSLIRHGPAIRLVSADISQCFLDSDPHVRGNALAAFSLNCRDQVTSAIPALRLAATDTNAANRGMAIMLLKEAQAGRLPR